LGFLGINLTLGRKKKILIKRLKEFLTGINKIIADELKSLKLPEPIELK